LSWLVSLLTQLSSSLKGAILDVLAAMATASVAAAHACWALLLSPPTAQRVLVGDWTADSVILHEAGVYKDLLQREAQSRRYPETAAFVRFLKSLVPVMDGEEDRPMVSLMVTYLNQHVLRRSFNSLEFEDQAEKWQLIQDTLDVLHGFLLQYVPVESDFQLATALDAPDPASGVAMPTAAATSARDHFVHVRGSRLAGALVLDDLLEDENQYTLNIVVQLLAHSSPHVALNSTTQQRYAVVNCVYLAVQLLELTVQRSMQLKELEQEVSCLLMTLLCPFTL
jgi:hypothetical protein